MIIIMTMTMTEIVDPETGINHTTEIDHVVEIDCNTTIEMITKMITKMTTEITIEMTIEKKIIGILKNRNIRESIELIMKIHMKTGTTRIIIEIVIKTKIVIETNIETSTEMTVMTKLEVSLKKKITYIMMMIYLTQKLKECKKFYKQQVKKKKWQ